MSSQSSRNNAKGFSTGSLILAGLLTAAVSAKAQAIVDNFEAGSNQNKFLGYTYFYDDSKDGGDSKVLSSKPGLVAGELLFDSAKSVGEGAEGSTKSLKLDFTFGATKPSCGAACTYGQAVGVGTQLVPGTDNGKVINLTTATSITFMAKATVSMKLRVEVTTKNVTDFGYFRAEPTVGTTWAPVTFLLEPGLGGVARPAWAETKTPGVLFAKDSVQKLQIQISADDNPTLTAGTLLIDNIVIGGYTWVPPSACIKCVEALTPKTGTLLSDLEAVVTPPRAANQNTVGGYWYAYNDISARVAPPPGTFSDILVGAPADPLTGKPGFVVTPAKGAGDATGGAYIKYALGQAFTENGELIQPFVGVGTKLSDQLGTIFFNATGSTGISFDYWTEAATAPATTIDYVTLEVKANQSLGTNAGAVHHILLPATAGVWKTATVPWTTLVLPDWAGVTAGALLDITKLDQIQWAAKGSPATTGALAVDNVRFVGSVNGIAPRASKKGADGLKMSQVSGRVQVSYKLPAGVDAAEFSIVDMKGIEVASRQVTGKGILETSLDTKALRSGLYVMQVSHNGLAASQSFTLLK
jgi:hypothetical protein